MRTEVNDDPRTWRRTCDLCGERALWLETVWAGIVVGGVIEPVKVCPGCVPSADVPPEEM